jgi:3-hydroxyacyl-[acyl-carrier-protein] dehydratase
MSLISKQITELIKDRILNIDSNLSTEIKFDNNFIGFRGHFPENPILPGVVIINVMIRMLELFNNKKYVLSQIKQAKFIEPVSAETKISFYVKSDKSKDGIRLNGKVLKSEKIISKISLVLQE